MSEIKHHIARLSDTIPKKSNYSYGESNEIDKYLVFASVIRN